MDARIVYMGTYMHSESITFLESYCKNLSKWICQYVLQLGWMSKDTWGAWYCHKSSNNMRVGKAEDIITWTLRDRLNITQTQSTRNDWVSWKYQQVDHHWNSKRYKTSKGSGASMKDVIENGFSTVWGNWAGSFNEEIQSVGEVMTIPSSLVKETWWGRRQQILEFVLWDFTTSGDMASSAL